jgi:predicted nucleic acid-binding protein
METVYIETTVVSYLVANPSRDPILAAHQQLTRQWWQDERTRYECVTSSEVIREAALGDAEMSRRRLEALNRLMRIAVDESSREQARLLLASGILPAGAASDALHVVVASQHRIKILLTWNCRHLANPHLTGKLRGFLHEHGLVMPEICTPVELMGD